MATTSLCGYNGSVTGATGALEIQYWEINQNVDAQEATSFDSAGWKERVACLKGATGNFRSIGHPSTISGTKACVFKDQQVGGYTISGNIIITKIGHSTVVDGIVTFPHDFTFTGAVTAAGV